MKILYGIQGTGNGHITRARAMAAALARRNAQVQFLVSGRPREQLFVMEPFGDYWWREGLTFRSKRGRIVLSETLIKSSPVQLAQDIRALKTRAFDLIVTDYEPVTAWAGRLSRVPVLGLGHQYAFSQPIPQVRGSRVDRLVLKSFAPANIELGLHWHHFNCPILPPIAPVSGIDIPPQGPNRRPILVYLPFESRREITQLLAPFAPQDFVIYHPEARVRKIKNLDWRTPSRTGFPQDLAACGGVICNAGFELASETLQLGKKILVKPLAGQVEQKSNALALEHLGWGRSMQTLDAQAVAAWLESDFAVQVDYPDTAAQVAAFILGGAKGSREELATKLWNAARLPQTSV